MLAAIAHKGEYKFRIERIDVPRLDAGDALVKVEAVAITRGVLAMWHYTDMIKLLPGVLGPAIAGLVAQVGSSVRSFQEGERVRVHALLTCGQCDHCRRAQESLCRVQCTIGGALYGCAAMPTYERYHNGGMAQYVKVPSGSLHRIPDNVPFDLAAHVGTVAGSFGALRTLKGMNGDVLVVTAASGASGASAVRCAPLFGFTSVCGVSTHREGLERLIGSEGLTDSIATAELPSDWQERQLLTAALLDATDADGVDAVVDFMPFGRDVTVQSIRAMKPGGRAVLSGGNVSELNLTYLELMRNQYQLKGIRGTTRRDEHEVLKLLAAERLRVCDLQTHTFPLSEANRALETVLGREGSPVFVVLKPWM